MMTSPSGRSKTEGKKEADQTPLISLGGSSSSSSAAVKTVCLAPVKGLSSSSFSPAIHFQRSATFPARASCNTLNGPLNFNPLHSTSGSVTDDEDFLKELGLDRVRDLRHGRNEEDRAITFVKKLFDLYRTGADLFFSANRETPNNGLPVSARANPPLTFTTFLGGVLDIPSTVRPVLIFLFAGLLKFLSGGDSPGTFEFKLGITTKASESILTLGEAIFAYESEIILFVLYLICYSLTWMLILPLHHGMVIVLGILLLCAPMLFLPNLVRKASSTGVRVALGSSFNMSLTGFTFTAAFGFFLIFGLVALLVLYFVWIFVRGRTPARGQDNEERRALWNVASLFGL